MLFQKSVSSKNNRYFNKNCDIDIIIICLIFIIIYYIVCSIFVVKQYYYCHKLFQLQKLAGDLSVVCCHAVVLIASYFTKF